MLKSKLPIFPGLKYGVVKSTSGGGLRQLGFSSTQAGGGQPYDYYSIKTLTIYPICSVLYACIIESSRNFENLTVTGVNSLTDIFVGDCDIFTGMTPNTTVQYLYLENNPLMTFIGTTGLTSLDTLYFRNCPNMTSINISNNTNLTTILFDDCNVTSLNCTNNSLIYRISAVRNPLTSITGLANKTNLEILTLDETDISSISLSGCTKIWRLELRTCTNLTGLTLTNTSNSAQNIIYPEFPYNLTPIWDFGSPYFNPGDELKLNDGNGFAGVPIFVSVCAPVISHIKLVVPV